jgi:hypothetical protein
MIPYQVLIDELLIGETPKEKYENLLAMKEILKNIAYPERNSEYENMRIYEFAQEIQDKFSVNELE